MGNKNSAPTAGNNPPDPAPASTPAPAPAPATRPISTGFFQAVTATVFRSRLPAQAPPPAPKLEQETTKSFKKEDAVDHNNESSVNPNSKPPGSTESIAPSPPASPIKNEDEQIKSLATPIQHEDEQTKSSATPIQNEDEQTKSSATPIQNEDEQIKSSATPIKNEHGQIKSSDMPIKNEAEQIKISASVRHVTIKEDNADSPKPTKEMKENKSMAFRRVASAGLQVESVLQRKTENLKDRYNLGKTLGQGQFGTTYLCLDNVTNQDFACKTIAKRKLTTPEDVEDVRKEIQIMHHLEGHPNIINIVGAYEDAVAVHLVMELCAGGELFDRIIQRGRYTERKAAELTRVIVGVVEACHSMGVIHRDLKPENFLFVDDEEESPLKAIDFGLSVFFKPGETFIDLVGSPYYVAPEVLKNHYGQECDVWSAGVIVYILLCGVPPFWEETEQGIFEQVLRGQVDFETEPWPSISDGAKDLVKKMLVRDPQKRLTAHEVLCHPWVIVDGVAPDKPLDSAVLSRLKQFSAMNKLKKMAIRIIAERLSEEEIAGLTEMFKMIDGDDSGQITLQELKTGLERVGANLNDSEIVDLMQAADIDNSGTIDYGEFLAAMLHLNKIQKEDHLMAAFSYFDKDGSGYITREELQQACEQFGVGDVHLDEMIREVDTDNDGLIDYSEFTAMMQDTGFGSKALQNTLSIGLKGSLPTPGTP